MGSLSPVDMQKVEQAVKVQLSLAPWRFEQSVLVIEGFSASLNLKNPNRQSPP